MQIYIMNKRECYHMPRYGKKKQGNIPPLGYNYKLETYFFFGHFDDRELYRYTFIGSMQVKKLN